MRQRAASRHELDLAAKCDLARAQLADLLHREANLEDAYWGVRARLNRRKGMTPADRDFWREQLELAKAALADVRLGIAYFTRAAAIADRIDPRPLRRRGRYRSGADCPPPTAGVPRRPASQEEAERWVAARRRLPTASDLAFGAAAAAFRRVVVTTAVRRPLSTHSVRRGGPRCHGRPRARRAAHRGATRAGPGDQPGEPEPPRRACSWRVPWGAA